MSKRLSFLILVSLFTFSTAHAQWLTHKDEHRSPVKPQVAGKSEREVESPGGPLDAINWYWRQRTFGLGYIPQDALVKAHTQTEGMHASYSGKGMQVQSSGGGSAQAASAQWSLVGPNNVGGRVNAIAIHPTDPKTIYIGAANGGVWKTTNGGTQWTPLTDQMQSIAMGALAIDPQVPTTVYAGTGEYSPAADAYSGYGLLRSKDGGATWSSIGPPGIGAYTRVIVNPKNSNIVYASAGRGGGAVIRTTDGGATWARILDSGAVTDMALAMNGNTAVLYAGVANKAVYRSMDGGDTWVPLDQLFVNQLRRVSLDVLPSNWKEVVVVSVDSNSFVGGQYVDDMEGVNVSHDGGDSWSDATPNGNIFISSSSAPPQGWYDVYVRMDPKNAQHFLLGGISIWETQDGGGNWSDVGQAYRGGIHPDQHEAAFAPSNPSTVVIGCDGGVYLSNDGGSSYGNAPVPMAITEYYGIGIDQSSDVTYGGAQDNGTQLGTNGADFNQFGGGDGAFAVADPATSGRVYYTSTDGLPRAYQGGNITNLGNSINSNENFPSDSLRWVNPFMTDPKNNILYFGCKHLYSSSSKGSVWSKSAKSFGFYSVGSTISAIGVFGDKNTLALGCGDGKVYYTTNNGANWLDRTKGLPGRSVTWSVFNPSSNGTFYVTLSGFGAGHVFKTTDGGNSWVNISSTLPDIPVNSIVMDPTNPSVLYIGTDVGVFFSPNDGGLWLPYGTGFPNSAAVDLEVQFSKRLLRVGTHGRSIWEAPMVDDLPGIATPTQRTIWAVGDTAAVEWHGFSGPVSIQISLDGGGSWQSLTSGASGTSYKLNQINYSPTPNTLVKVSDGTQTVTSALFSIIQQNAGAQIGITGELPYYLYDIAYDKDHNCLWGTNFSGTDKHIYKIDPDLGTLLDSIPVALPNDPNSQGLTGIKYDSKRQCLFVQRVSAVTATDWTSKIYQVSMTGSILKTIASPASYGTGILVRADTILAADRLTSTINKALVGQYDFSRIPSLNFSRTALYGPRGLSYDTKQNLYLLAYTDFEGTPSTAQLVESYVLFLDPTDGSEVKAATILDPSAEITNIRGMEYDPRGQGNTAWITTLASGGGAKIVKITLVDAPAVVAKLGVLSLVPSPIAFGNVDSGKTSTMHADLRNTGNAALTLSSLALTPTGTAFSFTGGSSSTVTLQPNDSIPLDFTFAPITGGQQSATLTANFSDGTNTTFTLSGNGVLKNTGGVVSNTLAGFDLGQSYPNPSGALMTIPYTLPQSGEIEIRILDNLGRVVYADTKYESVGDHERDITLPQAPNGNYVYELRFGGVRIAARKMTLMR